MTWQLRDPVFRRAVHRAVERLDGRCALAGTVGVQIHLAVKIGLDKRGPPAHTIELVSFASAGATVPVADGVPVELVDPRGFEASVEAAHRIIEVGGEAFPVASPEHILGMQLAKVDLLADAKWACFVLMRAYENKLDLEEARGFLKRIDSIERQSLLAELAYLAA